MWRKFIVEFCRIQKPINSNKALLDSFYNLVETTESLVTWEGNNTMYHHHYVSEAVDLRDLLDLVLLEPTGLSLVSYMARTERTIFVDDFNDQITIAVQKEMDAATKAETIESFLV